MAPLILQDDVLIVDRSVDLVDGRVAVIAFEGELLCKRIFRFRKGVILRSDSPHYHGYPSFKRNGSRRLGDRGGGRAGDPMNQVFALVDCNAFYCACERLLG